jgi:hypothetical protein
MLLGMQRIMYDLQIIVLGIEIHNLVEPQFIHHGLQQFEILQVDELIDGLIIEIPDDHVLNDIKYHQMLIG